MKRVGLLLVMIGWLCAVMPVGAGDDPVDPRRDGPYFETAECPFVVTPGESIDCGYLVVPENRTRDNGPAIRLAVVILHSFSTTPAPDPVIYLTGGPGSSPLDSVNSWTMSPLRYARDVILLAQRGTAYSDPVLDCPEVEDVAIDMLDDKLSRDEYIARYTEQALLCQQRLQVQGVDLSAYNSAASAADIADLRTVLGIDAWNLYGVSYGTRLALTVMRDFPDGIRSVVLDSVVPLDSKTLVELPGALSHALDVLFAGCAADDGCNASFPELEHVFYDTVERLNAEPVMIQGVHPTTGELHDIWLTGDMMIEAVFNALYSSRLIMYLPGVIYETYWEHYALMGDLAMLPLVYGGAISEGMQLSVTCHDAAAFVTPDEVAAAAAEYPMLGSLALGQPDFAVCAAWDAGTSDPVDNEPVSSDIPTLILSGEYDPITPPARGSRAAETLPNSITIVFPGLGHAVSLEHNCPAQIVFEFLRDPLAAPDTACIDQMGPPAFLF
ncbi:MAG: alpha/beta fold hydrolase [Anaerolineae bacterium]|nr:alpha/beta fold hydrolase [Anaerolineae bacterium]